MGDIQGPTLEMEVDTTLDPIPEQIMAMEAGVLGPILVTTLVPILEIIMEAGILVPMEVITLVLTMAMEAGILDQMEATILVQTMEMEAGTLDQIMEMEDGTQDDGEIEILFVIKTVNLFYYLK